MSFSFLLSVFGQRRYALDAMDASSSSLVTGSGRAIKPTKDEPRD